MEIVSYILTLATGAVISWGWTALYYRRRKARGDLS